MRQLFDNSEQFKLKVCTNCVYTKLLNLKVNLCGADFSFCLSGAEGSDAGHR